MKKIIAIVLLCILILSLFSCNAAPKEKTSVNIAVLAGPSGMGAAKLMDDNKNGKASNNYTFTVANAPDEVTASIINGSTDIAAVPTNLAAVLYQKTEAKVQVIAASTLGVLYVLDNTDGIKSVADLKGKKIYATGQAATPEYVLRYVLKQNGIDPDTDVQIEFLPTHADLAALLSSGEAEIGMLPEPNVSAVLASGGKTKIALDLTEEWNKISGGNSTLIQGCVVVNTDFAKNNKDAVDAFLKEYKASIEYANQNITDAAKLMADYGIVAKAEIAQKAIPNCNIVYMDGSDLQKQLPGFLTVLYEYNPASVGGAVPDENFYYKK